MTALRLIGSIGMAAMLACGGAAELTNTSGGTPPPPGSVTVTIKDFAYTPSDLTVNVGTTVRWTNAGPAEHTAVSDDALWNSGQLRSPTGGDTYGGGTPGGTFQFKFTQAGTFRYHCDNHPPSLYPGFTGTVTVSP